MIKQEDNKYLIVKPQHQYHVYQKDGTQFLVNARSVQAQGNHIVFYQTVEFKNDKNEIVKEQRPMLFLNSLDVISVQTIAGIEGNWEQYVKKIENVKHTDLNTIQENNVVENHIQNKEINIILTLKSEITNHHIQPVNLLKENNVTIPIDIEQNNINTVLTNINNTNINESDISESHNNENQNNELIKNDEISTTSLEPEINSNSNSNIDADDLITENFPDLDNLENLVINSDDEQNNNQIENLVDNDNNDLLNEFNEVFGNDNDDFDWEAAANASLIDLEEFSEKDINVNENNTNKESLNLEELEELPDLNDLNSNETKIDNKEESQLELIDNEENLLDIHDYINNEKKNINDTVKTDEEDLNELLNSVENQLIEQIHGQNMGNQKEKEEQLEKIRELANRDLSNNTRSSEYDTELEKHEVTVLLSRLKEYLESINRLAKQRFMLDSFVEYLKNTEYLTDIDSDKVASIISSMILKGRINYLPFDDYDTQSKLNYEKLELERMWLTTHNAVKLLNAIRFKKNDVFRNKINLIDVVIWLIKNGYIKMER